MGKKDKKVNKIKTGPDVISTNRSSSVHVDLAGSVGHTGSLTRLSFLSTDYFHVILNPLLMTTPSPATGEGEKHNQTLQKLITETLNSLVAKKK